MSQKEINWQNQVKYTLLIIYKNIVFSGQADFSLKIFLYYSWTSIGNSMICNDIWHKYHEWYFTIVINTKVHEPLG